jgi:hypothetical protein
MGPAEFWWLGRFGRRVTGRARAVAEAIDPKAILARSKLIARVRRIGRLAKVKIARKTLSTSMPTADLPALIIPFAEH